MKERSRLGVLSKLGNMWVFYGAVFANWWGWSFYKEMSDRAETFFSLKLCFPPAPTFDKCCPVPNNTEHLLNKEFDI